ncbi:MAG TPA: hypothetical protein PKO15_05115 [Fibrobacteria bacterium]|nr:hypothetical protein [Fibrobacteria bacterium]HOX52940.1 hypothetical protein [Fibrobacteria bacterium]
MPTDPIKLIREITAPKTVTPPKAAEGAQASAEATKTASGQSGKDATAAAAKSDPKGASQAQATASQAKAYVVAQSLKAKMSPMASGTGTRTLDLAAANANEVQNYFETAAKARKAEAAAATKADPLQNVLSDARGKTEAPKLSAEAQASIAKSAPKKEDAGMKAVDSRLASILGVSKIIGTA